MHWFQFGWSITELNKQGLIKRYKVNILDVANLNPYLNFIVYLEVRTSQCLIRHPCGNELVSLLISIHAKGGKLLMTTFLFLCPGLFDASHYSHWLVCHDVFFIIFTTYIFYGLSSSWHWQNKWCVSCNI